MYGDSAHLSSKSKALHLVINSINVMLTLFIWLSAPGDGFTDALNVFHQYLRVMLYFTLGTWQQLRPLRRYITHTHTHTHMLAGGNPSGTQQQQEIDERTLAGGPTYKYKWQPLVPTLRKLLADAKIDLPGILHPFTLHNYSGGSRVQGPMYLNCGLHPLLSFGQGNTFVGLAKERLLQHENMLVSEPHAIAQVAPKVHRSPFPTIIIVNFH